MFLLIRLRYETGMSVNVRNVCSCWLFVILLSFFLLNVYTIYKIQNTPPDALKSIWHIYLPFLILWVEYFLADVCIFKTCIPIQDGLGYYPADYKFMSLKLRREQLDIIEMGAISVVPAVNNDVATVYIVVTTTYNDDHQHKAVFSHLGFSIISSTNIREVHYLYHANNGFKNKCVYF